MTNIFIKLNAQRKPNSRKDKKEGKNDAAYNTEEVKARKRTTEIKVEEGKGKNKSKKSQMNGVLMTRFFNVHCYRHTSVMRIKCVPGRTYLYIVAPKKK